MTQRLGSRLAGGLLTVLVLAGCGSNGTPDSPDRAGGATPDRTAACVTAQVRQDAELMADVDLDGDGTPESVLRGTGSDACGVVLFADLADRAGGTTTVAARVELDQGIRLTATDVSVVDLPGRTGQLLLVKPPHTRGGFQARLFGYADGQLDELTAEGRPVFGFIATDVQSSPTAVECVGDGFAVTEARAHEPIGVVPAWDIYRTTYSVDGNTVTRGSTNEVADNVLVKELERQYGALTSYDFFQGCLAGQ